MSEMLSSAKIALRRRPAAAARATGLSVALLLAACGAAPAAPDSGDATGSRATAAGRDLAPAVRKPRLKLTAVHFDPLLDDLEARTFRFFWELADPANGLVPDRWPDGRLPNFSSIAAVGFGLTAYPIGVQRGLRLARRGRATACWRRCASSPRAPQGPEPAGKAGYKGFFYHFLDSDTGARYGDDVELSSIDTALLLAGALACQTLLRRRRPRRGGDPSPGRRALPRGRTGPSCSRARRSSPWGGRRSTASTTTTGAATTRR